MRALNSARMAALALAGLLAGAGPGLAESSGVRKLAIATIVEVPQLVETRDGVLQGLAERGFTPGKSFTLDYQNANGNMPTQQQIARKFVGEGNDVIVAITTPTAQAMLAATRDIPIVFVTVTDPLKAKLIPQFKAPGGNVTGVSDAAPLAQQLALFREIVPTLKSVGFVYNPGLDSSKATLESIREQGRALGIDIVESPAPTTNEVIPAARKLVGRVGAIYVPNDTTVVSALETIVKIGQETRTPVFTGETRGVDRGAAASLGLDYIQVGRLAGHMVADILNGKKPGGIDAVVAYEALPEFVVAVNPKSAAAMGVTIPQAVLARATKTVN